MEEEKQLQSLKMRTRPIGKLLLVMSLPAILSMLVQALYNVVDTIFVARYSPAGVEAMGVVFPLQMLVVAFAVGIGVGTNAQIAKKLGEGNNADATHFAQTGVLLSVVAAGIFVVLGLTVTRPFVGAFAKTEEIEQMGTQYLTLVLCLGFGAFVEICCSKILQATGNMKVPMISQLIGAGINIIFDPLLIFGVGFFPEMGVQGAAVATVAGQITSMCFVLIVFLVKKQDVSIFPKGFRFKKEYFFGVFRIGFPTMVINAIASVTTAVMNLILKPYDNGIAILGLYFKIQSFVFMPVFGLMQGAMPILSYNYGSCDRTRFLHAYRLTQIVAAVMMTAGLIAFQAGAGGVMRLFNAEGELLQQGTYALRVISISFIPAAFGIVMTTVMQSLGRGFTSLVMSLLRQIVLLIPLAALFSFVWNLRGAWFAYPVAEVGVCCIFFPLTLHVLKKAFASSTVKRQGQIESAVSD